MTMKAQSLVVAICFAFLSYGNAQGIVSYGGYINTSPSSYIIIDNGGSLTLDDYNTTAVVADLDGNTNISGNLINSTSSATLLDASTGLIEFDGVGTQSIDGPSGMGINSIKISNEVELMSDVEISTSIVLNSGALILDVNDLTVLSGGSITGGTPSSYIIPESTGRLLLYATSGGGTVLFPIGTSTSYTPATITLTSGTDQYIKARVIDGVWSNGTSGTNLATTDPVVNRTWILTADAPHQVDMTMQWNASDQVNGFTPSSALSNIYDSQWNTSSATIVGTDPYVLTLTDLDDIDTKSTHAVSASTNPLPIELLKFDGNYNGNTVRLNWSTASEINNDYFVVERSSSEKADVEKWLEIGHIDANGKSNDILNYNFNDNNPNNSVNVNYYRLKQVDYNGEYSYSNIIPISIENNGAVNVFPNPSKNGIFYINGLKNSEMIVYNNMGQIVDLETENSQSKIDLSNQPNGIYYIKLENRFIKIVKQ